MKSNILIGSHGVGKTSLINEIQKKVSIYTSDGFSRPIHQNSIGLDKIQQHILINELTAWRWVEDRNKNCVYSRSIIDSIIYTKVLYPNMKIEMEKWKDLFIKYKDCYNFFYIPIEFELERDGVRFESVQLQKDIDKEMYSFIAKFQLPFTTLSGSIDRRVDRFIETYKNKNNE